MVTCKIQIPQMGWSLPRAGRESFACKPWVWIFSFPRSCGDLAGDHAHHIKKEGRLESVLVKLRHEVDVRQTDRAEED